MATPTSTLPTDEPTAMTSPGIRSVHPTPPEISTGRLSPENLALALQILQTDGIVMLTDCVAHEHLDRLEARMVRDAWELWEGGFRKGKEETGNIQIDPPLSKDLFFEDVFLNPLAVQVTSAYLGGRPTMTFCSGNAAMHGTSPQPTHSDYGNFGRVPLAPFAAVINVGLSSMSPQNGSTQFYLGTHSIPRSTPSEDAAVVRGPGPGEDRQIRPDVLERRRKERPELGPVQPTVPKGALMIRDLRLWHGGMPNPSHTPRIMLAQIHFAPFYKNPMKIPMPVELRELVEKREDIEVRAEWREGGVDHLRSTTEHTFNFLEEERTNVDLREMRRGRWEEPMLAA